MEIKLKELKNINEKNCVSIILNTHRTRPENEKDPIALKNFIKRAENRLIDKIGKKEAKQITENLNNLSEKIDHSMNLDSLLLFANKNIAEFVRLPVAVEDRLLIDDSFATREIIRAMHMEANYLILLLSQQKVRLIEAFNDKFVEEINSNFPIENTELYSTNKKELSDASRQTNLVAEFFNRVDKELNKARKSNPLRVLICTEEGNYREYLKIADRKEIFFDTFLNKNRLDHKNISIIEDAWPLVKEIKDKENNSRIEELKKAKGKNHVYSDLNDIYKALQQGKIKTLFIEKGLFSPAKIENNTIELIDEKIDSDGFVDDIYDELIELNMDFGGETIFLPKGDLEIYNGIAAISRY